MGFPRPNPDLNPNHHPNLNTAPPSNLNFLFLFLEESALGSLVAAVTSADNASHVPSVMALAAVNEVIRSQPARHFVLLGVTCELVRSPGMDIAGTAWQRSATFVETTDTICVLAFHLIVSVALSLNSATPERTKQS